MSGFPPANGGSGGATITTSAPLSGDGSGGTPATIADGAIHGPKLAAGALKVYVTNGRADAGAITVPGVNPASGDVVESVGAVLGGGSGANNFTVGTGSEAFSSICGSGTITQRAAAGDTSSSLLFVFVRSGT
jgi:hypothetical protein